MPRNTRSGANCCARPALVMKRNLRSTYRTELDLQRCASCGAWWLHETREIAMNDDFDEMELVQVARLEPSEAEALTAEETPSLDFAFLATRPVWSGPKGYATLGKGWR